MLEHPHRLCGVCDGPNVRDLLEYAHFTAAAVVWDARGRTDVEPWQRRALLRLVAATAASRAAAGEPDVTLLARVVTALAPDQPGDEGWDAFALVTAQWWNAPGKRLATLSPETREAARRLARDRIALLEGVLPAPRRPIPLPEGASEEVLRERFRHYADVEWEDVGFVPHLLFGLPGAII